MLCARKDIADFWEEVRRVPERLNALLGAEFDLVGYREKVFADKRLETLHCQKSREIGAAPVILTSFGRANAAQAHHEATLSDHALPVVEDRNLDLDGSELKDAFMRRLRQVSPPAGFSGLPSYFPALVT